MYAVLFARPKVKDQERVDGPLLGMRDQFEPLSMLYSHQSAPEGPVQER